MGLCAQIRTSTRAPVICHEVTTVVEQKTAGSRGHLGVDGYTPEPPNIPNIPKFSNTCALIYS